MRALPWQINKGSLAVLQMLLSNRFVTPIATQNKTLQHYQVEMVEKNNSHHPLLLHNISLCIIVFIQHSVHLKFVVRSV